jgi:hypothetical protein
VQIGKYTVADFNNDGIPDIAADEATLTAGGFIEVFAGEGDGTFKSVGRFLEGEATGFSFISSMTVGDFNGDGFQDIAAADGFSDNLIVMQGDGTGRLFALPFFFAAEEGANSVVAADFNHDGKPDLALSSTDAQNLQGMVVLLLNNTR